MSAFGPMWKEKERKRKRARGDRGWSEVTEGEQDYALRKGERREKGKGEKRKGERREKGKGEKRREEEREKEKRKGERREKGKGERREKGKGEKRKREEREKRREEEREEREKRKEKKSPGPTAIRTRDLPICSRPPYHLATEPSIMLIMQFPRNMNSVL